MLDFRFRLGSGLWWIWFWFDKICGESFSFCDEALCNLIIKIKLIIIIKDIKGAVPLWSNQMLQMISFISVCPV